MKKSSKLISMILAVLMAASCFSGLTIFSASAADEESQVFYFEVPESWPDFSPTKVYCHLYNVYGGSPINTPQWQQKKEQCKQVEGNLYKYDLTSKNIGVMEDGADYALLFSVKDLEGVDHQTANVTVGTECIGDTVYVTGNMLENTEDSTKQDYEALWKNNSPKYGSKLGITSTGKIVGTGLPIYQPLAKERAISQFLCSWAVKNADLITPEIVQADCEQIGVDPVSVLRVYASDYETQLADPEAYPTVASIETVAALLGVDPSEATTAAPTTEATETTVVTEPTTTEAPETTVVTEPTTTEAPETTVVTEPTTEATETTVVTEPTTTEVVETTVVTEPTTTVVTEPTTEPDPSEPVYVVAGDEAFFGVNWKGSPTDAPENVMSKQADGTYAITYTGKSVGTYSLQVVETTASGETIWHGFAGTSYNGIFKVKSDNATVTITYNPETKEIGITGDDVEIVTTLDVNSITAVGGGSGGFLNNISWDPSAEVNHMTKVSENVYEITFEDVESDNYLVKFAANDSWTDNWGGSFVDSGVETDAEYNYGNIEVPVVANGATVKLVLDLTNFDYPTRAGAKFTVTITYQPYTLYGDVNGDGEVNISDATMIQKFAIGINKPEEDSVVANLADVDRDGEISILDVTCIQKYLAGGYNNVGYAGIGIGGEPL